MPRETPKLALTSAKAAATTYSFQTTGEGFKSWALCTVNDQTGELLITSDWGSWSYRWHASPEALGAPTLTAFIGDRGDVDYMARKLQKEGRNGTCFSAQKTAHELNRLLCARRLEDGREQLENRLEPEDWGRLRDRYTEGGFPLFSWRTVSVPTWQGSTRTEQLPYLTAEKARELWDEIESLGNECDRSSDLFWERLPGISGFTDYVTEAPWEHGQTEQTSEDKALRDIVLPALIEACKSMVKHRKHLSRVPVLEEDEDDDATVRLEALRAFVVGYIASRPDGDPVGQEAEDAFNRWWNDSIVVKAREERRKENPPERRCDRKEAKP